jgi:hypothetical protein
MGVRWVAAAAAAGAIVWVGSTGARAGQVPPASSPATQQPPQAGAINEQVAREHLTAAREALAQLTALPEAAKLQGQTRTQVEQLITNFNELITASTNWRMKYTDVERNLTALLGPPAQTTATGAVGTTGTATAPLDPVVHGKLDEVRSHLMEFAAAAGIRAAAPAEPIPPAAPSDPAQPPAAPAQASVASDASVHLDAIMTIVSQALGPSAPGAATGTTGTSVTVERTKLEEIKKHLEQLREIIK